MRTERTEGVGSADARELASGPRERRTAGSVGRAVMPASEALGGGGKSVRGLFGGKRTGNERHTVAIAGRHLLVASEPQRYGVSLLLGRAVRRRVRAGRGERVRMLACALLKDMT